MKAKRIKEITIRSLSVILLALLFLALLAHRVFHPR